MSNQNSPLKGFRPLKDSKTPSENPPSIPLKSPNPVSYRPPQEFSSSPNINPPQQKTICPYCSSPIPTGSSICLNCGNPVTQPNATSAVPTGNYCPHCGASNPTNASFCNKCGTSLIRPNPSPTYTPPKLNLPSNIQNVVTTLKTDTERFWTVIAGIAAVLAFICFFLPFMVLKVNNPISVFSGRTDAITSSLSGFQYLTAQPPSLTGGGGLGEITENLWDELNMSELMFADPSVHTMYVVSRILTLILLLLAIANLILVYQAYATKKSKLSIWMIAIGAIASIILFITYSTIGVSFQTGTEELDLLINSMVTISNGIGFWGMLIGFLGVAFSGYMRNKKTI
jgi:ribosomal protein L40E